MRAAVGVTRKTPPPLVSRHPVGQQVVDEEVIVVQEGNGRDRGRMVRDRLDRLARVYVADLGLPARRHVDEAVLLRQEDHVLERIDTHDDPVDRQPLVRGRVPAAEQILRVVVHAVGLLDRRIPPPPIGGVGDAGMGTAVVDVEGDDEVAADHGHVPLDDPIADGRQESGSSGMPDEIRERRGVFEDAQLPAGVDLVDRQLHRRGPLVPETPGGRPASADGDQTSTGRAGCDFASREGMDALAGLWVPELVAKVSSLLLHARVGKQQPVTPQELGRGDRGILGKRQRVPQPPVAVIQQHPGRLSAVEASPIVGNGDQLCVIADGRPGPVRSGGGPPVRRVAGDPHPLAEVLGVAQRHAVPAGGQEESAIAAELHDARPVVPAVPFRIRLEVVDDALAGRADRQQPTGRIDRQRHGRPGLEGQPPDIGGGVIPGGGVPAGHEHGDHEQWAKRSHA